MEGTKILTDEWIKKMWYIQREYYSAIKNNQCVSSSEVDELKSPLYKVKKRTANIVYLCTHMESRNMVLMNLFVRRKQKYRHRN